MGAQQLWLFQRQPRQATARLSIDAGDADVLGEPNGCECDAFSIDLVLWRHGNGAVTGRLRVVGERENEGVPFGSSVCPPIDPTSYTSTSYTRARVQQQQDEQPRGDRIVGGVCGLAIRDRRLAPLERNPSALQRFNIMASSSYRREEQHAVARLRDPTADLVPVLAKVSRQKGGACVIRAVDRSDLGLPVSTNSSAHPCTQGVVNLAKRHYVVTSLWIAGLIMLAFFQGVTVPSDRMQKYDKVMRTIDHKQ